MNGEKHGPGCIRGGLDVSHSVAWAGLASNSQAGPTAMGVQKCSEVSSVVRRLRLQLKQEVSRHHKRERVNLLIIGEKTCATDIAKEAHAGLRGFHAIKNTELNTPDNYYMRLTCRVAPNTC